MAHPSYQVMRLALLFLPRLSLFVIVAAGEVPAIIVFGDSSVDAGNNNAIATLLKSNFRPYGRDFAGGEPTGRFSNGRIAPDFISEAFGLKPTVPAYLDPIYGIADFATGVCFASAGTGYDNATSNVLNVIPLWKELEYYMEFQEKLKTHVGIEKANAILSQALYLISLGTNDFLENYYTFPLRRSQFTIKHYEDFLVGLAENFITQLYDIGARKISFTGVPPMGCLPLERARNLIGHHGCMLEYNKVALEFNNKLKIMVSKLNTKLHGIKIVFATSVYELFHRIIEEPFLFGFEVSKVACCATGTFEMSYLCNEDSTTCSNASKYVFWDAFHPSERTNQIISNSIIQQLLFEFH